ncbi:MAG TPA: tagatose-bisphosphate aldolase [Anaerolineaceae bacterium]|nr:tagatose-bisphosphate aldolase [Anaerolineaceae bacterium]
MPDFARSAVLQRKIQEHKDGRASGICSVCSTNRSVLEAAMQWDRDSNQLLLIESTCNQVNQNGGYTGLTPAAFTGYIQDISDKNGFPTERIFLGGDHLGPNPWKHESSSSAMAKAEQLVRDYVAAGYRKIHLDASMLCGGDTALSNKEIAERTVRLCKQAESAIDFQKNDCLPLYVIGTDVPKPGGLSAQGNDGIHVSTVLDVKETIDAFRAAFIKHGLEKAWNRTIAIVVSPGVEFGDREVYWYERERNRDMKDFIETVPGLVFEAHSTDYQPPILLRQMVEDHFAILKVGPALTFAYREALFNLAAIENEMPTINHFAHSGLKEVLMKIMLADPSHWREHYCGSPEEIAFSLKYSFNDRIRYYWGDPVVRNAVEKLINNLRNVPIPLALISQYFPASFALVRDQQIKPDPVTLIQATILRVLEDYRFACEPD